MGACLSSNAVGGDKDDADVSFHGNLTQERGKKVNEAYDMGEQLALGKATEIVQVKKKLYTKQAHGTYAMKFYDGESANPPDLAKEANILRKIDHPNIVKLHEVGKTNKKISLVMELCDGGSLADHYPYTEKQVSRILYQILTAVAYIHHREIVHRDICVANILFEGKPAAPTASEMRMESLMRKSNSSKKQELPLAGKGKDKSKSSTESDSEKQKSPVKTATVDENSSEELLKNKSDVKLIDFGNATILERWKDGGMKGEYIFLTEKCGTADVMSPEMIKGKYLKQTDMWSVGVIAYMLLSGGNKPFKGETAEEIQREILKGGDNVSYRGISSKQGIKFCKKLILTNPAIRLTAADALLEPFVAQGKPPVILPNKLIVAFQTFARSSPLKRVALNLLAYKAKPEQIRAHRDLFRNLDVNQSNTLTKEEFVDGFSCNKTGFSDNELNELFSKLDLNMNGEITYTEFLAATLADDKFDDEDELRDVFKQLDEDNSGLITRKNLLVILGDSREIKDLVNEMLKGHDAVSFDEFKGLFDDNVGDRNIYNITNTIQEEEDDDEE